MAYNINKKVGNSEKGVGEYVSRITTKIQFLLIVVGALVKSHIEK